MKSLETLRQRAGDILKSEPIWEPAFPPQPWSEEDLAEIAHIVEAFRLIDNVVSDDPWVDWLDRWKFYLSSK